MPKRHYPRHRPSAIKEVFSYLKARWKLLASVLGGIAVIFTSVGAISKNWDAVEPIFVATRGFTRENIKLAQQNVTPILRDLQIENTEGKKSAANDALAKWKLEKLKTSDPITHNLIDRQISEKEAEIDKLNGQLRTLNRLRERGD